MDPDSPSPGSQSGPNPPDQSGDQHCRSAPDREDNPRSGYAPNRPVPEPRRRCLVFFLGIGPVRSAHRRGRGSSRRRSSRGDRRNTAPATNHPGAEADRRPGPPTRTVRPDRVLGCLHHPESTGQPGWPGIDADPSPTEHRGDSTPRTMWAAGCGQRWRTELLGVLPPPLAPSVGPTRSTSSSGVASRRSGR